MNVRTSSFPSHVGYPLGSGRTLTREIQVGSVRMGGMRAVVLQSMLTTSAQKPEQALEEIKSLDGSGAELIRLSIPNQKELEAIPALRVLMAEAGITRPLVADIHFSPALAVASVPLFEKVRINPGNFSDQPKKGNAAQFDQQAFLEGREALHNSLQPFAQAVLKYGRAVRVGVNQGSLSQRMMAKFGDSPLGMVASAIETIEILESFGVRDLVVSLKSSNPLVVLRAYRLLLSIRYPKEPLPLHLGVTEAGDGFMGRIKSLSGVGPLLYDGIGDTLRVSLTEPCRNELEYGKNLLACLAPRLRPRQVKPAHWKRPVDHRNAEGQEKDIDGLPFAGSFPIRLVCLAEVDVEVDQQWDRSEGGFLTPGGLFVPHIGFSVTRPQQTPVVYQGSDPVISFRRLHGEPPVDLGPVGFLVQQGWLCGSLAQVELSCMLSEGLVHFLVIPELPKEELETFKMLLQVTRTRIYVTDYIACPSCARTLFDLEKTTAKIREKTDHLKGLKIGVMGCIVNGPGEMADADFGYIGSGVGRVDLYQGQKQVKRNLPESEAVAALIDLIKHSGLWVDP